MAEQKRLRKRNNFTLTVKAQSIIDTVPPTKKSKYISNLIETSNPNENENINPKN